MSARQQFFLMPPGRRAAEGFTIIELLVVVTLLAILGAFGGSVYRQASLKNNAATAVATVVSAWRRAQNLSTAVDSDANWGVRVQTGTVTVFQGTSYAARVTAFDEVSTIAADIAPTGLTEIVFNEMTGLPQSTGTLTFTDVQNATQTITINAKGLISY